MVYNSVECPVCYENMSTSAYILECGHTFCKTCILTTREYRNACPECRAPVLHGMCIRNGIVSGVDQHIKSLHAKTQKTLRETTDHLVETHRACVAQMHTDFQRQCMTLLCGNRGNHNARKRKWDGTKVSRRPAKRQKTIYGYI